MPKLLTYKYYLNNKIKGVFRLVLFSLAKKSFPLQITSNFKIKSPPAADTLCIRLQLLNFRIISFGQLSETTFGNDIFGIVVFEYYFRRFFSRLFV